MATRAATGRGPTSADDRFFVGASLLMVFVIIAGFSLQLAMGRSSFAAPPLVHAHAIVFMGWVGLYLAQNLLVAADNFALHRRLGWLAVGFIPLMLALGFAVTVVLLREGRVPFFFRPLQFLAFDPISLLTFAGLSAAAIALRRRSDWYRRLHFSAMAVLIGPGVGRLLPMPLLIPWAFEATFVVTLLFPVAGTIADWRRSGRVHPAFVWGFSAMFAMLAAIELVTFSPLGTPLYAAVTAGSPGAAVAPLAFPPFPGAPPA
jgi:hypothetical protein